MSGILSRRAWLFLSSGQFARRVTLKRFLPSKQCRIDLTKVTISSMRITAFGRQTRTSFAHWKSQNQQGTSQDTTFLGKRRKFLLLYWVLARSYTMYGMLLESVQHFVQAEFGEETWRQVLEYSGCEHSVFSTHEQYPDNLMPDLAAACSRAVGGALPKEHFMRFFGRCFVRFFSNFGYEQLIRASGRHFCDFLSGVDNIHQHMRFSYPKMKSPSMILVEVDDNGVLLLYRSKRNGFIDYFTGQLTQIADQFFDTQLTVRLMRSESSEADEAEHEEIARQGRHSTIATLRLDFDNRAYMASRDRVVSSVKAAGLQSVPVTALLELFPFGVLLKRGENDDLRIDSAGEKFVDIAGGRSYLTGRLASDILFLRRPRGMKFSWNSVCQLQSVLFEVEIRRQTLSQPTQSDVDGLKKMEDILAVAAAHVERRPSHGTLSILLKGQMRYLEEIDAIIFLCSPLANDLDELSSLGLYLNDLNLHGLSRDMVMEGWHQCSRLEQMCERASEHSQRLERSIKMLEQWRKRSDDLLCSMIPKSVADSLRQGRSALDTCQSFSGVSILFCELLEEERSQKGDNYAMEVVSTMNTVFSTFDQILDNYDVYKVETVGTIYMVVSGAPEVTQLHAKNIANVALALLKQSQNVNLPPGVTIQVRFGIHSGPVVAGVVGLKVPHYCLFGDTVNTAARMQSSCIPGSIQLSSYTKALLSPKDFVLAPRGQLWIKGKGLMETFWLLGNHTDIPLPLPQTN